MFAKEVKMVEAYCDGACRKGNPGLCACAFAIYESGKPVSSAGFFLGPELHTNNYAEYQSILHLLSALSSKGLTNVIIYTDSKLVVEQVNGNWQCRKADLIPFMNSAYAQLVRGKHQLRHVKGHAGNEGNELVDDLCNQVLDKAQGKE